MPAVTPVQEFRQIASDEQLTRTVEALEAHGIHAEVVATGAEAKERALELIPDGARVFNSVSRTLEAIGLEAEVLAASRFQPVRERLRALDPEARKSQARLLMAGPDVLVGSVQAVTEHGQVLVASATGSQLAPAAFGAARIIWIVGTQKLVRTVEEGLRRIEEHCLPLEDQRTRQVYGQGSAINKLLIVNGEHLPGRITMLLVRQPLGV